MQVVYSTPKPISDRTIRAFRRKSQIKRKVDPNRIRIFDITDEEIRQKIDEETMFTDFAYALEKGFTPTSKTMPPSAHWGGKYRCIFCTATGYFWRNTENSIWWGYVHGNNCRKRVDATI